jgi:UDP-N-acetylmuramate dehydrogenase
MSALVTEFTIQRDICLKKHNTLALPARADYFCRVDSLDHLYQAIDYAKQHHLNLIPIGEGSNVVLADDVRGLVIDINLKGIDIQDSGVDQVQVTVAAGENWHHTVESCLWQSLYGLENLALIPGKVGAAPIQNIGAYGVELSDVFTSLSAIEIATGNLVQFNAQDCQFAYRSSIFKQGGLDQYIIVSLCLELSKIPIVHAEYPALKAALKGRDANPEAVFEAVCRIRREKLPDPAEIPNVGSFFKNPVIKVSARDQLVAKYPSMPSYSQSGGLSKIPAAWLIEQCGYKGRRQGNVGVHNKQALVLVNFQGDGTELLALARNIQTDVKARFGIDLVVEPRIYGDSI